MLLFDPCRYSTIYHFLRVVENFHLVGIYTIEDIINVILDISRTVECRCSYIFYLNKIEWDESTVDVEDTALLSNYILVACFNRKKAYCWYFIIGLISENYTWTNFIDHLRGKRKEKTSFGKFILQCYDRML